MKSSVTCPISVFWRRPKISAGRARLISIAKGDTPADLILSDARIINVFTGEIESGNVAIGDGRIAGVGDYRRGKQVLDLEGRYLAPGFIDGHVHLESSMLDVGQYARAVVPRGTSAIVTDLHEIANVSGLPGMRFMMDSARRLPLELFLMAPSFVPATHLETAGARLDATELWQVLRWRGCLGLGEMMNFPGVLSGDDEVLAKIELARNKVIDGHAPGVGGKNLNGYIAAGIYSDHESVSLAEAEEKLGRGMFMMIREGSSEKNLEALLPLISDQTWKRCLFVVDDRNCVDLFCDGGIDAVVRRAITLGLDPVRAVQLATINPAEYFRLSGMGAVAPGYRANLIVIGDLPGLRIDMVFYRGRLTASEGKPLFSVGRAASVLTDTVRVKPFPIEALRLRASGEEFSVIEVVPGQIVTRKQMEKVKVRDGVVVPDIDRDILKLVVVERHKATGNIGLGLVSGFGLKRGALASSIAHDSHNIVAVGTNDEDIYTAVKEVERMHGGLVVVDGSRQVGIALPIAGLLSPEPLETVVGEMNRVEQAAAGLGTELASPFAALSFLALPVIPELRLTDLGLVDVRKFKLVRY